MFRPIKRAAEPQKGSKYDLKFLGTKGMILLSTLMILLSTLCFPPNHDMIGAMSPCM